MSSGPKCSSNSPCIRCRADQAFLRSAKAPVFPAGAIEVSIADLFSGCGGMTAGLAEAARRTGLRLKCSLAADFDESAVDLFKRNFPASGARTADVGALFPGSVGSPPTQAERRLAAEVGRIDVLVGGPPCQGHSDLNNHTRRSDPKNALYLRMARAAEVLAPSVVVIENVPSVQHDKGGVVRATLDALVASGYKVASLTVDLRRIGVPQRRRRFVLLASALPALDPAKVLESLTVPMAGHRDRTVRWAIGDLLSVESESLFDTPSGVSKQNEERMAVLFKKNLYELPNEHRPECHRDGDHSYVSVYGRLRWGLPAQTITTGFGSMGQGRFVHPQRRRTLTPHEAARLQTFPDWFDFGGARRGVMATAIGNAVPPLLMAELGSAILPAVAAVDRAVRRRA